MLWLRRVCQIYLKVTTWTLHCMNDKVNSFKFLKSAFRIKPPACSMKE